MSLTLPQLCDGNPTEYKNELPHVLPQFFMPRLQDRPQDPIMDTLRIKQDSNSRELRLRQPPAKPVKNTVEAKSQDSLEEASDVFWERTAKEGAQIQSQIRSWDSLRPSFSQVASLGPFLSEQSDSTFAAARYWYGVAHLSVRFAYPNRSSVNPRLQDPDLYVSHVSTKDLFVSIQNILVGNSSSLYQWDPLSETFVLPTTSDGKQVFIVVDGKDDLLMERYGLLMVYSNYYSSSLFQLHGALLNNWWLTTPTRLIREWSSAPVSRTENQSVHSFAHALTTCVENIRLRLSKFPDYSSPQTPLNTSALFLNHEEIEAVLEAIASLCGRTLDLRPSDYPTFSSQPDVLLSRCYKHLQHHFEKGSTLLVRSMLAHIFTVTSGDYLQTLSRSVGYSWGFLINQPKPTFISTGIDVGDEDDQDDNESISSNSTKGFPSFISSDATEILVRAKKSLKFLSSAQPDHTLLRQSLLAGEFHGSGQMKMSRLHGATKIVILTQSSTGSLRLRGLMGNRILTLEQFKVFGLEPENFPPHFPLNSNAIASLRPCVIAPHSTLYSSLWCAYISAAFASVTPAPARLQAALFSDSDDWDFEGSTVRAMAKSMHSKSKKPTASRGSGLSGLLASDSDLQKETPGLLAVLTELLPAHHSLGFSEGQSKIFAEAEFRLGFAIRDLPAGSGRERWLNPSCIECVHHRELLCSIDFLFQGLDFLLMDYKPPPPLDIVITTDVLSNTKCACRLLSHDSRPPTLSHPHFANNLLLRFRLAAQSFVSALASHVPDVAVRGNVDPFLARLTPGTFKDVFELADAHSDMMDDVLSACLLRSNQRTAGEALRGCMELVLDLCVLAGERRRSRVEEYAAVPVLETLYASSWRR
ncbi:hypothetical protein EI94DRAFT_1797237 [Lactarius quietus]|nr:hypothetical protein EI94DRAFT_1797237 [Lactarius quietus]